MRFLDCILPALAAGGAVTLLLPGSGSGFSFLGGSLTLEYRDFRVHENFTDPEANDNQTPDRDFPGSTGATLAIRKAVAEWGSELHGTGMSDPTQPDGIGSGGANFDSTYQGLRSNGPGGPNGNVFSELTAFNGLVRAFTETPIRDGWRIRFFGDPYVWQDGPDDPGTGHDIQAVATHEYGHALGLGHSTVPGATMDASGSGVGLRSIDDDDRAGLQALYGVKSATKPRIRNYHLDGKRLTILGENFDTSDNTVWFTRLAPGGRTPVKARGVPSSLNGTLLSVDVPARAATGDVLVKTPGQSGADLSNAFPFDLLADPCVQPTEYGQPKTTSLGGTPEISADSVASVAAGYIRVRIEGALPGATAVLFSGPEIAAQPIAGGTLYVGGALRREHTLALSAAGDAAPLLRIDSSMLGTTRFFQYWFEDEDDPFGSGWTAGLQVTVCP